MGILSRINKEVYLRTQERKVQESTPRDPKKVRVKKLGQAVKSGSSGDFEDSPVDLAETGRAYYTDSYIRRAVDKHSALMFKNGWMLSGKNDDAVEYVRTRLKLMSEATGSSIESFLQEAADNLVLYGNSYLVKARARNNTLPSEISAVGYSGRQPVAGYFPLPSPEITISRDDNGEVLSYQQTSAGGGEGVEFQPSEVIHFAYRRPSGRAYGIPFVFNTLDDVRLLRQIEENVARLIYRNLFPLYLYKVGLDKPGFEATEEEIEELRDEIREIPVDGALVVPERHNVEVIGSAGQAMDASSYLRYFRQRVFAGLGVSDTIMGISDTANRSTSDNQSADLNDTVKDFQKLFADTLKFSVINELLFEGGYDPILNEEDEVEFHFSEIEFDAKTKKENHILQIFMQNGITFEEMRELMGREKEVDESRLYVNLFDNPTHTSDGAGNTGDNLDKPENQHGKQDSPGEPNRSGEGKRVKRTPISESQELTNTDLVVNLQESVEVNPFIEGLNLHTKQMEAYWDSTFEDIGNLVKEGKEAEMVSAFTTRVFQGLTTENIKELSQTSFVRGFNKGREEMNLEDVVYETSDLDIAAKKHENAFKKLIDDVNKKIESSYKEEKPVEYMNHVFKANRFRVGFITSRIAYESYNYRLGLAAQKNGYEKVFIDAHEDSCDLCKESTGEVLLVEGWRENIPPHHTNCTCEITTKQKEVV